MNNNKNNAKMIDVNTIIQAGINPKNGLPYKLSDDSSELQQDMKRFIRIQDLQDAIGRYTWYNLPDGLNGNLLERILYYKGQAAFFYMETNEKFYFLPYALDGTIDCYGRYLGITPLPFAGGTTEAGKKQRAWIQGLTKKPVYEIVLDDELTYKDICDSAVLLSDYTKQIGENIIPRSVVQECVMNVMSETIPAMRTSLINSTGVSGMRVNNEDEQANVYAASKGIYNASMSGQKYIPIIGSIDFQEFKNSGGTAQAQEFLMAYQSLNNLRLSGYGIGGGVFQKLGSTLQSESDMNNVNTQLILEDGLYQRQHFCNLVNSIWNLGIWCEINENLQVLDSPNENEASALMTEGARTEEGNNDGGGNEVDDQ